MAVASDFNLPVSPTGQYLADHWDNLASVIRSLHPIWKAMSASGNLSDVEPVQILTALAFGSNAGAALAFGWRIRYDQPTLRLLFEQNTGSEAAPVWAERFRLDTASATFSTAVTFLGALTISGALGVGGNLNMGGFDITNGDDVALNTINGWSANGHAGRHVPGGADAIATAAAVSVAASNAEGGAATLARSDHTHRGVASLDVEASGAPLYGAVNIDGQTRIAVTKVGQDVRLNFTVPGRTQVKKVANEAGITNVRLALTSLTAIAYPATADGARRFSISVLASIISTAFTAADWVEVAIHSGTLGTTGDPVIVRTRVDITANGQNETMSIPSFEYQPAVNHVLTVSMVTAVATLTVTSLGDATGDTYMSVVEIPL